MEKGCFEGPHLNAWVRIHGTHLCKAVSGLHDICCLKLVSKAARVRRPERRLPMLSLQPGYIAK